MAGQADTGAPPQHRYQETKPIGIDAAGLSGGRPIAGSRHECLDLDEQRPASLHGRRDDAPRRGVCVIGEEGTRRVGDFTKAVAGHLEHADLIRRPEAVLRRADQPKRCEPLTFEA